MSTLQMPEQNKLPAELEAIVSVADALPQNVRELIHYALVMLMVEDGKAQIIRSERVDNVEYLTFKTIAGDVFDLIKPQVSEEKLATLRDLAREIMRADEATDE